MRPFFTPTLLTLVVGLAPMPARGQDAVQSPPDRTLGAFAVLDSSTLSIEHVDPLHSTTLRLFSALRNSDVIPRDMGVEFVPFLVKTPGNAETVAAAYRARYDPSFGGTMLQFLSASIAISQNVTRSTTESTLAHVSLGVRTLLTSGRPNSELSTLMDRYDKSVADLDAAIEQQRDAPNQQDAAERATALLVLSRSLLAQLGAVDKSRVGFMLEAGGAYALAVPNSAIREARVARRGFWATPIYRFDKYPVMLAGTARVIAERERDIDIIDAGGRATVRRQGIFYSLEGIVRHRSIGLKLPTDDVNTARLMGGITYGFNKSSLLTFIFGKNYRDDFSQGGTLVASFGVTIGLSPIDFAIPRGN
jgi:hypothetical protein